MVIAIFDIPRSHDRNRIRRRLHELGFVHLFENVMLSRPQTTVRVIRVKLGSRTTGRPARVLLVRVSPRAFDQAVWIHHREAS